MTYWICSPAYSYISEGWNCISNASQRVSKVRTGVLSNK